MTAGGDDIALPIEQHLEFVVPNFDPVHFLRKYDDDASAPGVVDMANVGRVDGAIRQTILRHVFRNELASYFLGGSVHAPRRKRRGLRRSDPQERGNTSFWVPRSDGTGG